MNTIFTNDNTEIRILDITDNTIKEILSDDVTKGVISLVSAIRMQMQINCDKQSSKGNEIIKRYVLIQQFINVVKHRVSKTINVTNFEVVGILQVLMNILHSIQHGETTDMALPYKVNNVEALNNFITLYPDFHTRLREYWVPIVFPFIYRQVNLETFGSFLFNFQNSTCNIILQPFSSCSFNYQGENNIPYTWADYINSINIQSYLNVNNPNSSIMVKLETIRLLFNTFYLPILPLGNYSGRSILDFLRKFNKISTFSTINFHFEILPSDIVLINYYKAFYNKLDPSIIDVTILRCIKLLSSLQMWTSSKNDLKFCIHLYQRNLDKLKQQLNINLIKLNRESEKEVLTVGHETFTVSYEAEDDDIDNEDVDSSDTDENMDSEGSNEDDNDDTGSSGDETIEDDNTNVENTDDTGSDDTTVEGDDDTNSQDDESGGSTDSDTGEVASESPKPFRSKFGLTFDNEAPDLDTILTKLTYYDQLDELVKNNSHKLSAEKVLLIQDWLNYWIFLVDLKTTKRFINLCKE